MSIFFLNSSPLHCKFITLLSHLHFHYVPNCSLTANYWQQNKQARWKTTGQWGFVSRYLLLADILFNPIPFRREKLLPPYRLVPTWFEIIPSGFQNEFHPPSSQLMPSIKLVCGATLVCIEYKLMLTHCVLILLWPHSDQKLIISFENCMDTMKPILYIIWSVDNRNMCCYF